MVFDIEYYLEMEIQDLFNEIIDLEGGDLWDGMSSTTQIKNTKTARKAFGLKMKQNGIHWEQND